MPAALFTVLSLAILACSAHAASAQGRTKSPAPLSARVAPAPSKLVAQPPFDSAKVRELYLDGDFEEAIRILETALREKRVTTHKDSVFVCKHLGVMYAANSDTREKGKYFMHLLLTVEATAKILDMFASDMIYMIFKNIQEEFEVTRVKLHRAEGHVMANSQGQSAPVGKEIPVESESKPSRGHTLAWVGGTAALAAVVGVTAYFLMADDAPETQNHIGP